MLSRREHCGCAGDARARAHRAREECSNVHSGRQHQRVEHPAAAVRLDANHVRDLVVDGAVVVQKADASQLHTHAAASTVRVSARARCVASAAPTQRIARDRRVCCVVLLTTATPPCQCPSGPGDPGLHAGLGTSRWRAHK